MAILIYYRTDVDSKILEDRGVDGSKSDIVQSSVMIIMVMLSTQWLQIKYHAEERL